MDNTPTLREIESWPVEDRLRLAEAIWDSIAVADDPPQLSEEFKSELRRRAAMADQLPSEGVTWDEIVTHVRRRR